MHYITFDNDRITITNIEDIYKINNPEQVYNNTFLYQH